jgi:TRAP-type C4-dicarboxylate transport system permease small subunit
MSRPLEILDRIEQMTIAVLAGGTLLLASYSMATRYLLPAASFDWAFEVIIYVMGWIIFLSAARLISHDAHIRVDVLVDNVGPVARRWLLLGAALFGIAVASLLVWSGMLVVLDALRWGETSSSSLRLPMWLYYLCLPVGCSLMVLRLLAVTWSLLREAPHAARAADMDDRQRSADLGPKGDTLA